MVSLSTGTASFSPSETPEEKRKKELVTEKSKKQEQNTAPDTQSGVSADQNSNEHTAQARISLPGKIGAQRSTETASASSAVTDSQTSSKKDSETPGKDLKGSSLDLFDRNFDKKKSELRESLNDDEQAQEGSFKKAKDCKEKSDAIKKAEQDLKLAAYRIRIDRSSPKGPRQLGTKKDLDTYKKARDHFAEVNNPITRQQITKEYRDSIRGIHEEQTRILEKNRRLTEAESLEELKDNKGALAVLEGKSYSKTVEMDTSLGLESIKNLAENGLSSEALKARQELRSGMSEPEKQAREYQEAVTKLSILSQEQIKGLNAQINFLGQAAENNPNLSLEQRNSFLAQQQEAHSKILGLTREASQLQQLQTHVTNLIDKGNFDEVNKLQKGESKFETQVSFNDDKAVESVINSRPRFTQEQEKQTTELLLKQTEALQQRTKKLSGMLARDGNQSHEEAAEYHGTWYGADYSTNLFDKHNGNRLTGLGETERLQSGKMQRASNTLEDTQQEAEKFIQQGEYTKARETLEKGLEFANQEFFDTQKIIARERTDPAKLGEVLQNIDTSYKAVRNGIIMAGAAIVTGGVAANFMAGGGLLSAGAAGASQTSLSGLAATKAFAMGTGSATAAAFGGDVVGSLAQGMTANEALQHSSEQILENAKNAALGSLGAITGIGVGGRLASSLLSPQASASLQHLVRSSTAGATGSIPGVVNDIASKVGERQGLISELTQAGKNQEEIDKALAERKLDFNSISLSSAASLVSGAASGYIGSLATRANSSALVQGLTRTEATAANAAITVAEELTQVAIAAAESTAQGYKPGTLEFERALIANLAGVVPCKVAGAVSTKTSARPTEQAGIETTKKSTLDESGQTEFLKIDSDGVLQTTQFKDDPESTRAVFEESEQQQLARTEQIKQARELAITRNSELTRDVVNRLLRNYSRASIKIKTREDAEIISQGSSPKSKEQRVYEITLQGKDRTNVKLEISESDLQKSNPYIKLVSKKHSGLQDLNPNYPAGYRLTERDRILLQRAIEGQLSVGESIVD